MGQPFSAAKYSAPNGAVAPISGSEQSMFDPINAMDQSKDQVDLGTILPLYPSSSYQTISEQRQALRMKD